MRHGRKRYLFRYFFADGKEIKTVKTSGFQVIELPAAPTKEDYDFKG